MAFPSDDSKKGALQILKSHCSFGGSRVLRCSHVSKKLNGLTARFSLFVPPSVALNREKNSKKPSVQLCDGNTGKFGSLLWLSGLTCTDENFITKASTGLEAAAAHEMFLIIPDTSPRGANISGEDERYDIGTGASFYVNCTKAPYKNFYQMYSYIVNELLELVDAYFPEINPLKRGIMGHSMGGHGALVLGLRNNYFLSEKEEDRKFISISAFSPICAPTACQWGKDAFSAYFLFPLEEGSEYDAQVIVSKLQKKSTEKNINSVAPIWIDVGTSDEFFEQLHIREFNDICKKTPIINLKCNYRENYDHSYFFVSTFIAEHVFFHAKYLNLNRN